jgi:hypothetical protein
MRLTDPAVLAIRKELPVLHAATLQTDLPAVRSGTGQIDARDGIGVFGNPHE